MQAKGRFICESDEDCVGYRGRASVCLDSTCSDPYERGCLHHRLGSKRVCNSDDPPEAVASGFCRTPSIDHLEVRLFARDWESSLFQAWILQIVLSELLDVPTTIETGQLDIVRNFYKEGSEIKDTDPEILYNDFSDMHVAFNNADTYGDCRKASKFPGKFENCAHVTPEAQNSAKIDGSLQQKVIETPRPTGGLGKRALFIPKFTAERDPSLLSYLGLQGEENREKMANTFQRPTRWKDYCAEVSTNNCTASDSIAFREPRNSTEENRFFVPGLYRGHFRKTVNNDCNQTSECTGHLANFPCGMESPITPLLYHLNIAMEGDGNQFHSKGYLRWELREIWKAANATKSNVAMYWWSPDTLFEDFVGSNAEMTKVSFPLPTQKCQDIRRSTAVQCSAVLANRVGDPAGACEENPSQMSMVITTVLRNLTFDVPEPIRSPAYEALSRFTLSDLRLAEILDYKRANKTPRQAVCEWVDENFDLIQETIVPPTYPRTLQENGVLGLMFSASAIGAIAFFLVLWTVRETHRQRRKPIVRHAQVDFLFLVLAGSLLIAVGAVLVAIPISNSSCMAQVWFIHLGYTLSLVPQIVKVAAINRLMMAARRFQRMYLDLKSLYGAVAMISSFAVVFLIIWSVMDPPREVVEYELTDILTSGGNTVVQLSYACSSDSDLWELVAISWNGLLLLCAVVLAFQTRSLHNEFNESQSLGNLIVSACGQVNVSSSVTYSHASPVCQLCIPHFPSGCLFHGFGAGRVGFGPSPKHYFKLGRGRNYCCIFYSKVPS